MVGAIPFLGMVNSAPDEPYLTGPAVVFQMVVLSFVLVKLKLYSMPRAGLVGQSVRLRGSHAVHVCAAARERKVLDRSVRSEIMVTSAMMDN